MSCENPYLDLVRENANRAEWGFENGVETYNGMHLVESEDLSFEYPREWDIGDGKVSLRRFFATRYAWAIPNERAIETIVSHSPIIEVAAGSGYWASLIEDMGGDIIATDSDPWDETYTDVHELNASQAVRAYRDRALFTCWPAYDAEWTSEFLDLYEGDTVIYIGEPQGGCTGDARFHRILQEKFGAATDTVVIPRWQGVRDMLYVFER